MGEGLNQAVNDNHGCATAMLGEHDGVTSSAWSGTAGGDQAQGAKALNNPPEVDGWDCDATN